MSEAVRYSGLIQARCQPGFGALVDEAAKARGMSPSEWLRQAARTALALEGVNPDAIPARDAGALYDARDGLRCYALVSGGRVLTVVNYSPEPDLADTDHHPAGYAPGDGDRWLPVVHVDSEPFEAALHWRLPHLTRVEPGRVVREFPVVPKSLEAM